MRKLLFTFFLLSTLPILAQDQNGWAVLADVSIESVWDDLLQQQIDRPVFGKRPKSKEGNQITLEGYMVPLDDLLQQKSFVISSLPFQTCFFCGGAGPETVAEIRTTASYRYTDAKIKVKGKLRLNDSNPLELYYILENAIILD